MQPSAPKYFCSHCSKRVAIFTCNECVSQAPCFVGGVLQEQQRLCSLCNFVFHDGKGSWHRFTKIEQKCGFCNAKSANIFCVNCQIFLCSRCDTLRHSEIKGHIQCPITENYHI